MPNAYRVPTPGKRRNGRLPGLDATMTANHDPGSFSGTKPGEPAREEMLTGVKPARQKAGRIFGAASMEAMARRSGRAQFGVFHNGPSHDGWQLPAARGGAAPARWPAGGGGRWSCRGAP